MWHLCSRPLVYPIVFQVFNGKSKSMSGMTKYVTMLRVGTSMYVKPMSMNFGMRWTLGKNANE